MSDRPDEGVGSVLRQALVSGAIVGVILLTIVAAILLTYVIGGSDAEPPVRTDATIIAEASTSTPTKEVATDTVVAPAASATYTIIPPSATSTPTEKPAKTDNPTRTPSPTVLPATATATTEPAETTETTTKETDSPCVPPANWQAYVVQSGDTLSSLAEKYGVAPEELREGNCLDSATLTPDQNIYVPITETDETPTVVITPCVPPAGWTRYTVRPGDALGVLAAYCGTTVEAVMQANCMTTTTIFVGTNLYLPCVPAFPTRVPWPTLPAYTPAPWPTATTIAPWTPAPTVIPPTSQIPPLSTPTPQVVGPTAAPTQAPPTVQPPAPTPIPPTVAPVQPQPTSSGPSIPPLSTPTPHS